MTIHAIGRIAAALAAAVLFAGCATVRSPDPRDPWEPMNRVTWEFNDTLDRALIKPVAEGYRAVTPTIVRTGVRNFFSNLRDPWIAVNQLLQGKVEEALSDAFRFIANSTFGFAGIYDIASDMGMQKHNEDFGQTLAAWGVPYGPYLVLPILGPSSGRDGVGLFVDTYGFLPWQGPKWLDFNHRVTWQYSLTAFDIVQIRESLLDATAVLEQAALDRYAFTRNAYFQRRRNLIYDGDPPPEPPAKEQEEEADEPAAATEPKPSTIIEPKPPATSETPAPPGAAPQ
jgi:phospholipid-binding lipoprotein MlaA